MANTKSTASKTVKCPNCGADSSAGNYDGKGTEVCMTCRQPLEHKEAK